MFFKPNFCCNCGEKIQRAEWKILSSRRFCDVCEIELKGQEWIGRGVLIAGILFGLLGIGTYLREPGYKENVPLKAVQNNVDGPKLAVGTTQPSGIKAEAALPQQVRSDPAAASLGDSPAGTAQIPNLTVSAEGPIYFCGAMTKKGKPCSRRVKTKGRCWQHTGQPAALVSQSAPDVY